MEFFYEKHKIYNHDILQLFKDTLEDTESKDRAVIWSFAYKHNIRKKNNNNLSIFKERIG